MAQHPRPVVAALQDNKGLVRIAGGNETEVYRTADQRYVVKLKHDRGCSPHTVLAHARAMRNSAEQYAACLGPRHSIPSYYLIADDHDGDVEILVVQPFVAPARPLHAVDITTLNADERACVVAQLREIVRRAWICYRATGSIPDLYGRNSRSRSGGMRLALVQIWEFLVTRTLLRSHNLLLTDAPARRVVLVDYDLVHRRRHAVIRRSYFAIRGLLFLRDLGLLLRRPRNSRLKA